MPEFHGILPKKDSKWIRIKKSANCARQTIGRRKKWRANSICRVTITPIFENGQTKLFSEKLLEIADIFGVELHDLLNPDMRSVTILVNENHAPSYITSQNQGNRYDTGNAEAEIEKLNMTVAHQSEMLKQKDAELTALRDVLALLKQKLE